MVNIIIESNQITEPKFWNSWKGFIIREIVLANVYKRDEIIKRTQIQEEQFDQALRELFQNELITERSKVVTGLIQNSVRNIDFFSVNCRIILSIG